MRDSVTDRHVRNVKEVGSFLMQQHVEKDYGQRTHHDDRILDGERNAGAPNLSPLGNRAKVLRRRDIRRKNVDYDELQESNDKKILREANRKQSDRDDQAKGRVSTRYKSL